MGVMVVLNLRASVIEPFLCVFYVLCPLVSSSLQPSKEGIVIQLFQKTPISKVT